jgi:hypothetical protein
MTSSTQAKSLAFRYLFKTGVVKENTVTVFGETGETFKLGTDYDEEINLQVPYLDLSNFVLYYGGGIANGAAGSTDPGSLRSLNSEVQNIKPFNRLSLASDSDTSAHYYVGDIVLWDPETATGTSSSASCWTCIRTKNSAEMPLPFRTAVDVGNLPADFNGMLGIDNLGQNYIAGIMPAKMDTIDGTINFNPYWKESLIAHSYVDSGNYYTGQLVIHDGAVYMCISTDGTLADPALNLRTKYTVAQEQSYQNGDETNPIPGRDLENGPNGEYGYDSQGTRYIMGVPPSGGVFSSLYWRATNSPKLPSAAYVDLNWDNLAITNKIRDYDSNITGGTGAQTIPEYTDDYDHTVPTIRKVYDDNEAGFVLTNANKILASIPAAAIKGQSYSNAVQPDNTLLQLVHLAPYTSSPAEYSPAVQGVFEESISKDMLIVSGAKDSIQNIVITNGSSNYLNSPPATLTGGLTQNPSSSPYRPKLKSYIGIKRVRVNKKHASWPLNKFLVGDNLKIVFANPNTKTFVKTEAILDVLSVTKDGNLESVQVTNAGEYYVNPTLAPEGDNAKIKTLLDAELEFLTPIFEVKTVDLEYNNDGNFAFPYSTTIPGFTAATEGKTSVFVSNGSGTGAVGWVNKVDEFGVPTDIIWNSAELTKKGVTLPANIQDVTADGADVTVAVTGDAFTFGGTSTYTLTVGNYIIVTGTNTGDGVITGYTSGKKYYIKSVESQTITLAPDAELQNTVQITTDGALTGLTFRLQVTPITEQGFKVFPFNSDSLSGGSGYVSNNYSKDIVYLTLFVYDDSGVPSVLTRLPAEVTNVISGAIANTTAGALGIKILTNSGYTTTPLVSIPPPLNTSNDMSVLSARLGTGISSGRRDVDFLYAFPFLRSDGDYSSAPNVIIPDEVLTAVNALVPPVKASDFKTYLGVSNNQIEVKYGGSGYSLNDEFTLESETLGTSRFLITWNLVRQASTDYYSDYGVVVLDGGSGYSSAEGYNRIVLNAKENDVLDKTGDQIVLEIKKTGGAIQQVSFSAGAAGSGFAVNDYFSFKNSTADSLDAVFRVTAIGPAGVVKAFNSTAVDLDELAQFSPGAPSGEYANGIYYLDQIDFSIIDLDLSLSGGIPSWSSLSTLSNSHEVEFPDAFFSKADVKIGSAGTTISGAKPAATTRFQISDIEATAGSNYASGDILYINQKVAGSNTTLLETAIVLIKAVNPNGQPVVFQILNPGQFSGDSSKYNLDSVNIVGGNGTGIALSFTFVVSGFVITNPGKFVNYQQTPSITQPAFDTNPSSITLSDGTTKRTVNPTWFKPGRSTNNVPTATARYNSTTGNFTLIGGGYGYKDGAVVTFTNSDFTTKGKLLQVVTQSNGVLRAVVVPGYAGSDFVAGTTYDLSTAKGAEVDPENLRMEVVDLKGTQSLTGGSFKVTTVTPKGSISKVSPIRGYTYDNNRLPNNTVLYHKTVAKGRVTDIEETTGKILSVDLYSTKETSTTYINDTSYFSGGYGYTEIPTVKFTATQGGGAKIVVNNLSPTRVEYTGRLFGGDVSGNTETGINGNKDIYITVGSPPNKESASALAIRSGDLSYVNVDLIKNPQLLETLESLKAGSTDGFAKAVPNFGLAEIRVIEQGSGYQPGSGGGAPPYEIIWSEPDLPVIGKKAPTVQILINDLGNLTGVTVIDAGTGYSSPIKGVLKETTVAAYTMNPATIEFDSKIVGVYIKSSGRDYKKPPIVQIDRQPDNNAGEDITFTSEIRASIDKFNILNSGSYYKETPDALVISEGNGVEAKAVMCVTSIEVVPGKGGKSFAPGDILNFGPPPSSITYTNAGTGTATGINKDGNCVVATVTKVDEDGAILKVTITPTVSFVSTTDELSEIDEPYVYGGTCYTSPPKLINSVFSAPFYRPLQSANFTYADIYTEFGQIRDPTTIADKIGPLTVLATDMPELVVKLGVRELVLFEGDNVTTKLGSGYLANASVIIDSPPPSQQANYYATVSKQRGAVTAISKISSGVGYEYKPVVGVEGGGYVTQATATANMGISFVSIISGGSGYKSGDIVTFTQNDVTITKPCLAKVTSVDSNGGGLGKGAIFINRLHTGNNPTTHPPRYWYNIKESVTAGIEYNSTTGRIKKYGGFQDKDDLILWDRGSGFKVGDIITLGAPNTVRDNAVPMSAVRTVTRSLKVEGGKLKDIIVYMYGVSGNYFKLGDVIKVKHSSGAVAFIRVNTVGDYVHGRIISTYERNTAIYSLDWGSPYPLDGSTNGDLYSFRYFTPDTPTTLGEVGSRYAWVASGDDEADIQTYGGAWGTDISILYSTDDFPASPVSSDFTFELMRRVEEDVAYILVTRAGTSQGDILDFEFCDPNGAIITAAGPIGNFFLDSEVIDWSIGTRGAITYIDVLEPGEGYEPSPEKPVNVEFGKPIGLTITALGNSAGGDVFESSGPHNLKLKQKIVVSGELDTTSGQGSITLYNGTTTNFYVLEIVSATRFKLTRTYNGTTVVENTQGTLNGLSFRLIEGGGAEIVPLFGVVSVTVNSVGTGYTSAPQIYIDPPVSRSLTAQGYARSATLEYFDTANERYGLKILSVGGGYTGDNLAGDDEGTYQLIGGNLHAEGSSANSVDTVIKIKKECFTTATGSLIAAQFYDTDNVSIEKVGSNYQVGDVLQLVAIGTTTTSTTQDISPIYFEVTHVSDTIDKNDLLLGLGNIVDAGPDFYQNGQSVGGHGDGYVRVPNVKIVGGDQGVKVATSLGIVNVDFLDVSSRGNSYKIGDQVKITGGGFNTPVSVGYVKTIDESDGSITQVFMYSDYKSTGTNISVEVERTDLNEATIFAATRNLTLTDATPTAVFGVTNVVTTIKPTGGFLGKPIVMVDSPTGFGNIVQPLVASILPSVQWEVSKITPVQTEPFGTYTYKASVRPPIISIDTPLGAGISNAPANASLFNGWRTMRFNKNDSFEFVIQYVIGKAISFQVDPDVSLPSTYYSATQIKVAGVTIPLRQPGAKGFQGREMSANKIIRRYRIKLIGV